MDKEIGVGDLVVVTLARVKGFGYNTSAAVVEEVYGDVANTMRVRLTGLTPQPYDPGMVLAIDGDKIKAAGW